MLKYSVGLDVSAKEIHCCLSVIDQHQQVKIKSTRKISNTARGFKDLADWIKRNHKQRDVPLVVCMEATGVYYENCAMYLYKACFAVSVILPNHAKKYLQASGQKSKNDQIDAKGLAQMGAEKSLKSWEPMGEYFYLLRELTRHHEDLQQLKTMLGNRLHASLHGMYVNREVVKQLRTHIALLERQVATCEREISNRVESTPQVKKKVGDICQIKGLGIMSVVTVLAETNGFALFTNARQVASYAGYDIIENQSGKRVGKTRISKKGNNHIRRILHMPALCVIRYKVKPFADLYERTFAKHGIKMKSYVAVQKKLLTIIYALWKKSEAFDEHYTAPKPTEEHEPVPPGGSAALTPGATVRVIKKVVPTAMPALHQFSLSSERSLYASSGVEQS